MPQNIVNSLWSVAKLVEARHLTEVNAPQISELLAELHAQRTDASLQDIANCLWSVAKLVDAGRLMTVNVTHINELLTKLHAHRTRATPQNIANCLWSVAKLVEAGLLTTVNVTHINELLDELHVQRTHANTQEIVNSLWASGIIKTVAPSVVISNELAALAFHQAQDSDLLPHKRQVLIGLSLLGLHKHYNLSALIAACRPVSVLKKEHLARYTQGAVTFEKEAFIVGFFVDLLVVFPDGKKKIIEFDGPTHQQPHQQFFDAFRDKILLQQGFEIVRRPSSVDKHKKGFFAFPKKSSSSGVKEKSGALRADVAVYVPRNEAPKLFSSNSGLTKNKPKKLRAAAAVFVPASEACSK